MNYVITSPGEELCVISMFITVILIGNDSNLIILFVQHSTWTGVKARTHGKVTLDEYQRLHECRETCQTMAMTCQAVTLGKGLMLASMTRKQNTKRTNVLTARRHIDSDGKAVSKGSSVELREGLRNIFPINMQACRRSPDQLWYPQAPGAALVLSQVRHTYNTHKENEHYRHDKACGG